jgi:hypothetical protein
MVSKKNWTMLKLPKPLPPHEENLVGVVHRSKLGLSVEVLDGADAVVVVELHSFNDSEWPQAHLHLITLTRNLAVVNHHHPRLSLLSLSPSNLPKKPTTTKKISSILVLRDHPLLLLGRRQTGPA